MVAGAGARRTGELVVTLALAAAAVACSGDDVDDAGGTGGTVAEVVTTSTAPARPTTTTSLVYDPSTVEGQVEAAYLKSWDVYADAVYNLTLDEAALASVYADPLLTHRRGDVAARIRDQRAALVRVDHSYEIAIVDGTTALVTDRYRNHQVLIDPVTKVPTEEDPNELLTDAFSLARTDSGWRVTDHRRL